jgi:hypothetical protein
LETLNFVKMAMVGKMMIRFCTDCNGPAVPQDEPKIDKNGRPYCEDYICLCGTAENYEDTLVPLIPENVKGMESSFKIIMKKHKAKTAATKRQAL